jgi:3-dehydroquinate dehydratase-2
MSITSVLVLSGPNLSLLGSREPDIYGTETLADHIARVEGILGPEGIAVTAAQTESESCMVQAIHDARGVHGAIIVNAGALTHYAWSLHDALRAFPGAVIEVHLSNPAAREPFRHQSVLAPVVAGSVAGFGSLGYELAARAVLALAR